MPGNYRLVDKVLWAVWIVCVLTWTFLLLTTGVAKLAHESVDPYTELPVSKFLHVGMYAFLTILAGTLKLPNRWILLIFLSFHAMVTEFFQQYVPGRSGTWQDAVINHVGISLGIILGWYWWRGAFLEKPLKSQP